MQALTLVLFRQQHAGLCCHIRPAECNFAGVFLEGLLFSRVIAVCFMSPLEITAVIVEFFITSDFTLQGLGMELPESGGRLCESF